MLWCSLSVFIGLSAISQGGVTRFIPGILGSTTILFYLIVIRANSVTYGLAIAYAFVQALLLVWSIWLLSRLISNNDIIRSLIILILSVSYPAIVFSLCLEQYVSSFFWLIMAGVAVMYDQKKADLMIIGAANGLLTSAFMVVWKRAKSFVECRTYKMRQEQVRFLQDIPSEEHLWQAVIAFQDSI